MANEVLARPAASRSRRIAIVGADEQSGAALGRLFSCERQHALPFETREVAFSYLVRYGACDMLLIEVAEPEDDGLSLVRQVRQWEHLREMPILVLSKHADCGDAVRALEAGADAFLAQPVSTAELQRVAARLVLDRLDRLAVR